MIARRTKKQSFNFPPLSTCAPVGTQYPAQGWEEEKRMNAGSLLQSVCITALLHCCMEYL